MREDTFGKIKKAVAYAAQNSPFYRQLYQEKGIESGDIKDISDFRNFTRLWISKVLHILDLFISKDHGCCLADRYFL